MRKLLLAFLFVCTSALGLFATHIVGGEVTYVQNGGSSYNVTLKVYRDDFNGNPAATFDDPAVLVIYDQNGNYISQISMFSPMIDQQVDPPFSNPCLEVPTNVEIQEAIYTGKVNLPDPTLGYHLVYARCCRNGNLINNLTNPGDQGGLYTAYVPPRATFPNSNPVYDNFPPIFICEDSPLFYDHSATDADGDSLVYSICAPYQGLSPNAPVLQPGDIPPPNMSPPFNPVTYLFPYNAADPLGGVPLAIDSATGLLTGTPDDQGTYVVGICVTEYRNGVFLSTTIRDFQYTVTECNFPNAQTPIIEPFQGTIPGVDPTVTPISGIYERNCEDYTINFNNISSAPSGVPFSDLLFEWDFGDGSPTSTDYQPIHTYADTGTYLVQLDVAVDNPLFPCVASFYAAVLIYPDFMPDFTTDNTCISASAGFVDLSTAPYDNVTGWDWSFGDGGSSSNQNPTHQYTNPGTYGVNLEVTTEKGCVDDITRALIIHPQPDVDFSFPSPICENDTVFYNNETTILTGNIVSYFWDLKESQTSANANPANIYPNAGTFDILLVATSDSGCVDSLTQPLIVNPLPSVNITADTIICPNTNIQLQASGGVSYVWTDSSNLSSGIVANPTAFMDLTPETFTVEVTDANNCVNTDAVFVDLLPLPPAEAGEDTSVCLNVADVTVFNTSVPLQASGGVIYNWSPSTGLSSNNTANTVATPLVNTTYLVAVTDTNNCIAIDSVRVTVLNPALDLISVTVDSLCIGDTVVVDVEDQGQISTYSWTPTTFVSDPTANEPAFYPPVTTEYELSLTNYCYQDQDTILIEVLQLPNLDAGPLDSICLGDPPYQLNATPNDLEYYLWTTADPSISDNTIFNPTVEPQVSTTYYLTGIDSIGTFGCVNEDSVGIIVYNNPVVDITLPLDFPGFICLGSSIALEAITPDGIQFAWSANPMATFDDPTAQVTNATPIDTTQFNVVTTNTHGCSTADSIILDVQLPVNPAITGDSIMCYGGFVNLEASGGLYYEWLPAGIFNNPDFSSTQAFPDSSLIVSAVVSNDCFDSIVSMPITVYPLPTVDAGDDITVIRDDASGFLLGTGSGTPLWYAEGETLDGIIGTPFTFNPELSPFETTNYILQVEDPLTGCLNEDTATVFVEVITLLAFPTGFSPNGDGTNEFARILKYLNIKSLKSLSIYNRWGELVFITDDIEEGWDGQYKTLPQEVATYSWVIEAVSKDNEQILRKGNITLIR